MPAFVNATSPFANILTSRLLPAPLAVAPRPRLFRTAPTMVLHLSPSAVYNRLKATPKPVYIDVRTPAEFRDGHVPRAINVPVMIHVGLLVPSFVDDVLATCEGAPTLILGCKSGKRSSIAVDLLQRAGVEGLVDMDGGFDAWLADSDLPVER